MKAIRIALAGMATLFTLIVSAQTADEIVSKHIDAIGGADAWRKVTSLKQEGSLSVQGMQVGIVTTALYNKGFRLDLSVNGMNGYQIMTPVAGWNFMPFQGQTKAEPSTEEQVKEGAEDLDVQGFLVDYKQKGHTVTLIGKEDVDGVDAFKVQAKMKSGKLQTLFFDPKTYYVIRTITKQKANGQEMDVTANLSNYKKLPEGILVPMSISLPQGELVLSKVTVNGPVDETIFKPTN